MAINLTNKETNKAKANDITYTVLEECGTIDTKSYTKKGEDVTENLKLRYLAWNNGEPRYDLRWWIENAEGEKCGKGVGLTGEALIALGKLITELQNDTPKAKETTKACKTKRNASITKKK